MKTASKVIFLFKDSDGFSPSMSDALQPNPNNPLEKVETSFELSLAKYGIIGTNASGDVVHFVDPQGVYQVSVLLLESYEPPVVACAVNEVLVSITGENSSTMPTIILPFLVPASKLNWETTNAVLDGKMTTLYGTHIGQATSLTQVMVAGTQKPPPSLQIHYEPLACLLHLVRILNLPTVLLFGPRGRNQSKRNTEEEFEALYEMGQLLANNVGLCFSKDRIHWDPTGKSKGPQEPWRALYG